MDAYERLREAYARDVIDLEEFERHVEGMLGERPYALPLEVLRIGPNGPMHVSNFTAMLKEAWTEDGMRTPLARLDERNKRVLDALG